MKWGDFLEYNYFHQDHIGSSNVITDATSVQTKLIEYTPYGLTNREEGSYNTDCKFTGQLFDTSTELYYYGARYYDPELGRFTQPDTIVPYPSDPQSFNRYAYARNNPIKYIDPTGHVPFTVAFMTALAMIATFSASVSMYATAGALIAGGRTEQVFSSIAQISGMVSMATNAMMLISNSVIAAAGQTSQLPMFASNSSGVIQDGDVVTDTKWIALPRITITPDGTVETAARLARASLSTSGVAAGSIVINAVISAASSLATQAGTNIAAGVATSSFGSHLIGETITAGADEYFDFALRHSKVASKAFGRLSKGFLGKAGPIGTAVEGLDAIGDIKGHFAHSSLTVSQKFVLSGGELVESVVVLGASAGGVIGGGAVGTFIGGPGAGSAIGSFIGGVTAGAAVTTYGDRALNALTEKFILQNLRRLSATRYTG